MVKTLIGTVDKPVDAQRIIEELVSSCRCDRSDISLITRDEAAAGKPSDALREAATHAASAAQSTGDALAALWGAGTQFMTRAVPGFGALRAIGPFGSTLLKTGFEAGATLARALVDAGLPESQARHAAQALERGGIVITVHAQTENAARCAEGVLASHGAVLQHPRAA
ncbi:MAG: hypothetical protein ACT4P4_06445 [Betaproteobacteria bacterium]